ncbi:MAG: MATE family efflux transporter [Peptococcaceae bacterium]|jgi:putative MATE family efflux protein|nr:MATE family efflux transporter [Peptococcaceae bacterium]
MVTSVNQGASEFAAGSVSKLLFRFSVPSIVSMLVNSIYNIVDQIFIGQGVGYYGNAATNVAFPLVTICLALSLWVGNGAAASFSLRLGAGQRREAEEIVGNASLLSIITGLLVLVLGSVYLEPLLRLFGATAEVMPYAKTYAGICLFGMPFVILSLCHENVIRADGSPRYAMLATLTGAVINTILDPLFIFVFGWGVAGAAYATIIGQAATAALFVIYLPRFKLISYRIANWRLRAKSCKAIYTSGISSFLTQVSFVFLQIVMNNTLTRYGALSPYGEVIPLACMGIVMKVNQIMIAFVIGISVGAQPIIGYNYGAGKLGRVLEAYRLAVLAATGIMFVGFLAFEFFPLQIINVFGQENQYYTSFAVKCFRIFLMMMPLAGFQILSSNFFQMIGKPLRGAALSLSRQILLLIPLILLFARLFGLEGVLYAGPAADVLAAAVTAVFTFRELRQIWRRREVSA